MIKKILCAVMCAALCLAMAACTEDKPATDPTRNTAPLTQKETVPLTQEEKDILEAMGSDIHVVTDDTYINIMAELINHTAQYMGKVYQFEGRFSVNDKGARIYRTLVCGSETMSLGLPLRNLEKEIPDGAWIRVTAIVAQGEIDGQAATVLDAVAIEAPEKSGKVEIPWDGDDIHSH